MDKSLVCLAVLIIFTHGYLYKVSAHLLKSRNQRELIYLQILTTNGFFAPLQLYETDENTKEDWPEGLGLLTKLGKLQQFELGKMLRRRYDHFITTNPAEVDTFSAADDRSTISVLSLAASLYAPTKEWQFVPGFRWQPLTLSYMDQADVFFSYKDFCINLMMELARLITSEDATKLLEKDKFLYNFWTEHSGSPIVTWEDAALLYDVIEKEDKAGLKVPRWARMHMNDLKRLSDFAYTYRYNSTQALKMKVGSLIDLLTLRMRVKVLPEDQFPEIKTSVYVTHDWNLAALMSAMRLSNGRRPPPAATINFELYQDPDEQHSVRMLFFNSTQPERGHQEPHILILNGCTEYCPLSTFVKFFEYIIPNFWGTACGPMVVSYEVDDDDEQEATIYPMYEKLKNMTTTTELLSTVTT